MKRVISFLALVALFAGTFGTSVHLKNGLIDKQLKTQTDYAFLLPSANYMQVAALGYKQFLADFMLMRVIQIFGATRLHAEINVESLGSYFDTITDLDPHYVQAYSFGHLVIGEEAGRFRKGLDLLDKGIQSNPNSYRLGFEAAFFSFWDLDKPEMAKAYLVKATAASDCPDWVDRWSVFMDQQMGRYQAAYEQFLRDYILYYNKGEAHLFQLQYDKLRRAIDEWYVAEIRDKAIEYHESHGRYPTVAELEAEGAFSEVEWPDARRLFAHLDQAFENFEEIPSDEESIQALATSFMVKGWSRVPVSPANANRQFNRYAIWAGESPWVDEEEIEENPLFCGSEYFIAYRAKQYINGANRAVGQYRITHNGECPPDLETGALILTDIKEPWGGEWILDRERCKIYSTTYPDLAYMVSRPPL